MLKLFLRNIKKGFATNSSSYHSTLILTEDEFNKWKNGEVKINNINYDVFESDEYDEETGLYYYIESQKERIFADGEKIIAITYCESTEY